MCLCRSVCTGRRLFSPWLGRHAGIFDLFYTTKLKNKFNGFGGILTFHASFPGAAARPPAANQIVRPAEIRARHSSQYCDTMGFSLRGFAVSPLSGVMKRRPREELRGGGAGGFTGSDHCLQILFSAGLMMRVNNQLPEKQ